MRIPHPSIVSVFSVWLIVCLFTAFAFSDNGYHRGHGGSRISVNITPGSASLQTGQSQQFTGSVSGTSNTGLNWLVNGVLGGNSSVGTVSPSGLYVAPSAAPASSVTVTAQSVAQSTAKANATVTISSPVSVSVSVSPASTSLKVGQSQAFSATVSGTSNTAVNWLVNGTLGGSSTYGTISSSGMYQAPATVPSASVVVEAQSVAQSTAMGKAAVSIMPVTVSVSISPTNASVQVGQSQQFSAAVSGTTNTAVNWLVSGILGGNTTVGTISSAGLYAAPGSVPSSQVTVTAQSVAQSTASASATVTISAPAPVSVSVSPASTSLKVGQSQAFSATVSGTSNTAVSWLVNGTLGGSSTYGTVSSSGMYTAPAVVPSSSVLVEAQSSAQSTAMGKATVSVMPATVTVSISPTNVSLPVGQTQQFSAAVSGTTNTAVNWLVSGIVGGNTSVGTISSAGLYSAPGTAPSGQVTVTAQSIANTSSSASTYVTVTQPVQHSVSLSWSDTASVAGYNVYRGTQSTGPFVKINASLDTATVYTDNSVTSGQTYYYATTAVGTSGAESAYSNVAQATIP